jgi:hypothetical protein
VDSRNAKKPKKHRHIAEIGYNAPAAPGSRGPIRAADPTVAVSRAIMANEPKDLMALEIDEELRRERLLKLWDKYGTFVLAAVGLVIASVGGWQYYQYRQAQANEAASTQYVVALGDFAAKRPDEALKRLEALIPNAPAGYAALARLRLAAYDVAAGSTIDALAIYDQVAKDKSVDPILQDFARLQIAMLKFDTVTFPELRNQLTPLANDRSPWRYSARELLGMGALNAGWPHEARNHFQRLLSDRATPPGIAERARMMVAMLDEAERVKGAPGAAEKPGSPPKAEAGGDKAKAEPGKAK